MRGCVLQDDTYTESYISTIGVDFVSAFWLASVMGMATSAHRTDEQT